MDSSMYYLGGNYSLSEHGSATPYLYTAGSFGYDQDDFFPNHLAIYRNEDIIENPDTCNPVDVMGPEFDFDPSWECEWPGFAASPTAFPEPMIAPGAPVLVQLMTPPTLVATPAPPVPTTPKRPSIKVAASRTGILSPPPSERLVRTRRYNAYDELCQLSNLELNTPRSKKPTDKSGPVFAAPLPPVSCVPNTPVIPVAHHDTEMRYLSPPSCYSSSSSTSSATFSPIDSPSSGMSDSFGGPLTPPETPFRCATRRSGVDRPRFSRRGSGEKPYLHPYGDPTPSGERERPHGCRHLGNIVPGDVPCDKNFARMHDWVRHQRVHTGQTPYKCLGCCKEFKRSDARGRHWDGKSSCETYHMDTIREQLFQGQITAEHPDVPILRRRTQKAEYRKESKRTGVPVQDLKATMQQLKHEDMLGPGF